MRYRTCALLPLTLAALGCGEDRRAKPESPTASALSDETEASDDVAAEDAQERPSRQGTKSEAAFDPHAALLEASFDVRVDVVGYDACRGSADLKLNTAAGKGPNAAQVLEIPAGLIDCAGYEIDLRELLGSLAQGVGTGDEPPIIVEGGVIALPVMGSGLYTPARPMFPSFLAEDRETLRAMDRLVNLDVYDQSAEKRDHGSVRLRVLSVGAPYRVESLQRTFDDTIQFELTVDGFEEVDRVDNFIFERMAFVMSLDPVALLHIEFEGPASDLADGADRIGVDVPQEGMMGEVVDAFGRLIDVRIVLDLRSMQGLGESSESEGPTLDGRPL